MDGWPTIHELSLSHSQNLSYRNIDPDDTGLGCVPIPENTARQNDKLGSTNSPERTYEMARMSNRRNFLKQATLLITGTQAGPLFLAPGGARAAETGSVVAETSYGKIRGTLVEDVKVFKGIPYGGSTAGTNRFMPPAKPAKWTGERDATAYGPTAPQTIGTGGGRPGVPAEDEDCLVLNVFTPSVSGGKRPVMVWLHGGGFSSGSGSSPINDGTSMAHTGDVVVVTINHRLNVLGSTYLGEAAGADFGLSGSVGMLDIVAALEWVRENIPHFGGDPNCFHELLFGSAFIQCTLRVATDAVGALGHVGHRDSDQLLGLPVQCAVGEHLLAERLKCIVRRRRELLAALRKLPGRGGVDGFLHGDLLSFRRVGGRDRAPVPAPACWGSSASDLLASAPARRRGRIGDLSIGLDCRERRQPMRSELPT